MIQIFDVEISPGTVTVEEKVKISVHADDVYAVWTDVDGEPIRDTEGSEIYIGQ